MIRSFFISSSGTLIAQLIIFFSLPLIAELWGAEKFGLYSTGVSIGVIVSTMLVFRLELIILNDDKDVSKGYLNCIIKLSIVSAFLIFLCVSFFSLHEYMLPIFYGFSLLIFNSVILFLTVDRKYLQISFLRILSNATFVFLALFFLIDINLIIYHLISLLIISTITLFILNRDVYNLNISFFKLISHGKKYIYHTFPASICNAACLNSMPIVIPFLYGVEKAGVFFLAYKTIVFPVGIIGQSLGSIFRRELLVKNISSLQVRKVTLNTLFLSTSLSLIFVLFVFSAYKFVVLYYFGDGWKGVLDIYSYILFLSAFMMIYAPLGHIFLCSGQQKIDLYFNVFKALAITGFYLSTLFNDYSYISFVMYFSFTMSFCYLIGIFLALYCAQTKF